MQTLVHRKNLRKEKKKADRENSVTPQKKSRSGSTRETTITSRPKDHGRSAAKGGQSSRFTEKAGKKERSSPRPAEKPGLRPAQKNATLPYDRKKGSCADSPRAPQPEHSRTIKTEDGRHGQEKRTVRRPVLQTCLTVQKTVLSQRGGKMPQDTVKRRGRSC